MTNHGRMIPANTQRVLKFVQELLLDEDDHMAITPAVIEEKIAMVLGMKPAWGDGLDHGMSQTNSYADSVCGWAKTPRSKMT